MIRYQTENQNQEGSSGRLWQLKFLDPSPVTGEVMVGGAGYESNEKRESCLHGILIHSLVPDGHTGLFDRDCGDGAMGIEMLSAQTTYSCSISEDYCQKRKQIRSEAAEKNPREAASI
ncbi:hypothetical protein L2E82_46004 [Cichorium intybus]|uniref:Uncharacterized protein n=1 Tax=Cichorium intybus TaxID=13427 RepID=A0ACB8ZYY2_CICIN|nr:hypothetical protein L2E82_46004 [Cichorium intybus]